MDKISLKGLSFFAYHGVFDKEKTEGQTFSVDCEIFLDTSLCNSDLNKTVHYGYFANDIVSFCKNNQFELLETLANKACEFLLLKYDLVNKIIFTINKPNAPIETDFENVSLTIERSWNTCYLALGSNLGNRKGYLDLVSEEIEKNNKIVEISKSSYIETEPYGVLDQPKFLNAVVKIKTILTPYQLLEFCKFLEVKAKRERVRHWGERTLDVDILFYSNKIIFEESLIIPHPEICLRDFVLIPLSEIEPYFIHPVKNKNIKELLKELKKEQ